MSVLDEKEGGSALVEGDSDPAADSVAVATVNATPEFSVFSQKQKWTIVGLASMASVFGPLSSNIYVPAIPQVAAAFNRSTQDINLTLTIFLVFQGTSPSVFSGLSDSFGRRPTLMICMMVYIAACIGIALTPVSAYWLLMVLRALQAIGGSPILGIGSGIVGDISTPGERGKYMGLYQSVAMIGPAFGPVLGGVLVQYLSWRWIFWVLAIWCGVSLVMVFFFLQETLRAIVGDGSIQPPMVNSTPATILARRKLNNDEEYQQEIVRPDKKKYQPFASLQMLLFPEIVIAISIGAPSYACMFASLAVFSTVLTNNYHYNDVTVGLCYLAQGLGSMLSGILGGRYHDWNFRRWKEKLDFQPKHPRDLEGFPIERVRFSYISIWLAVFCAAVIGYGWTLDKTVLIVGPLILSFIIGFGANLIAQMSSLVLIDMFSSNAGAVMAASNLIRCATSATMTAVLDPMISAMSLGWTFVLLAGFCATGYPLVILLQKIGPAMRAKRIAKWGPTA